MIDCAHLTRRAFLQNKLDCEVHVYAGEQFLGSHGEMAMSLGVKQIKIL
jgi:hypothetical protein